MFLPVLQTEILSAFTPDSLFVDVCIENSLGRQRSFLSLGQVCLLSSEIKVMSLSGATIDLCMSHCKIFGLSKLGFPQIWHTPVMHVISTEAALIPCGTWGGRELT